MNELLLRTGGIEYHNKTSAPWVSTEIFVTGCYKNCPDCFNQELRKFGGNSIPVDFIVEDLISNVPYKKITFSGGEPFIQSEALAEIARRLKAEGFYIVCYSGYTFEELPHLFPFADKLIQSLDILVDGAFTKELLTPIDEEFKFVGSSNQRQIDVQATLKAETIVKYKAKDVIACLE